MPFKGTITLVLPRTKFLLKGLLEIQSISNKRFTGPFFSEKGVI
jgi:hypothetical protein